MLTKTTKTLAITTLLLAASSAMAGNGVPARPAYGHSELCYQQTLLASHGTRPEELSTESCTRALRDTPMRPNDKSIVLYNRGLIERAKGNGEAARANFERAVALSRTVDSRNLALAQLAHQQGDYAVAIEHYELLVEAAALDSELAASRTAIGRNLALAEQAQLQQARRTEAPSGLVDD